MKVLNSQVPTTKTMFLSVVDKKKQLNQKLIDKAKALAGVKEYVTKQDMVLSVIS